MNAAWLVVSPEVLLDRLFPGGHGLTMNDVRMSKRRGLVMLRVAGPDIPAGADKVLAIIHRARETVTFQPTEVPDDNGNKG